MKNNKNIGLILFVLLLIILSFSLFSQAQDVVQNAKIINKVVLCKDVKENEPLYETINFQTWDEKAVTWISFNYHSEEPFLITWEWVAPSGKIYHRGEIEMEAGNYKNYRSWYWIGIWEHYAAKLPGEWKVKVYIEDMLSAEKNFNIE